MSDEEIAAELASKLHNNEELAEVETWVEDPLGADLQLFGIDGNVNLVAIVAFVRSKL